MTRILALALVVTGVGASVAAEAADALPPPVLPPCTCRAQGRVFDMGETTCLQTPAGPRLAICAMDQNVSSWRPTAQACPSAALTPRPGGPRLRRA